MQASYDLKKDLDYGFLSAIINGLNSGTYTVPAAKTLAKEFVPVVDATDETILKNFVTVFVTNHPEFTELPIIIKRHENDAETRAVLEKMRGHMQSGDLNSAIEVASQHTQ